MARSGRRDGLAYLTLALALNASPGVAQSSCPSLSGRYVLAGADGHVVIAIAQSRCTSIRVDYAVFAPPKTYRTVHELALDGQFQPDTAWFRFTGYQITAAQFRGRVLELTARSTIEVDSGIVVWHGKLALMPGGDLCIGFQPTPTATWGNVAARVEGGSRSAEDRALVRSARPCSR